MINSKEYAEALFLLAKDRGETARIREQLEVLEGLLRENPKYTTLLDTPAVKEAEKLALIDEALSSFATDIVSFVKILASKRAACMLPRCIKDFAELYDEECGIERVEAITAIPMTEKQKDTLSEKLGAMTGKTVVVKNIIDPRILGGVRVRCKNIEIDGSFKTRLLELEKAIKREVV